MPNRNRNRVVKAAFPLEGLLPVVRLRAILLLEIRLPLVRLPLQGEAAGLPPEHPVRRASRNQEDEPGFLETGSPKQGTS